MLSEAAVGLCLGVSEPKTERLLWSFGGKLRINKENNSTILKYIKYLLIHAFIIIPFKKHFIRAREAAHYLKSDI